MLRGFCVHWGTSTFSEVFLRPSCCLWQKTFVTVVMAEPHSAQHVWKHWAGSGTERLGLVILGQIGWVDWSSGLLHWEWTSREVETGAVWGGQDSRSDRWVLYREERQLCGTKTARLSFCFNMCVQFLWLQSLWSSYWNTSVLSALVMLLFGSLFYKKGQVWGCRGLIIHIAPALVSTALYYLDIFDSLSELCLFSG